MPTNPNEPAFGGPVPGLTKREYFAGLAMQGLLANHGFSEKTRCHVPATGKDIYSWRPLAMEAVEAANELIAALDNEDGS